MREAPVRRRGWWGIGAVAFTLCALVVIAGPAKADQPALQPSSWPEVMTLEEASRFLRISPAELAQLADGRDVPARNVAGYWRFSRAALLDWLAAQAEGAQTLPSATMPQVTGTGTTLAQGETAPPAGRRRRTQRIGEAPEERTAEEVFLRGQRVLLAPGEVTLDSGLFYSKSDNQQLVLVNGAIGLATVEQDTFTTLLLGRYGLLDETELFASTTYRVQDSDVLLGSQKLSGSSLSEFGDVRLGMRRTVLHENVGIPDVIVTGDGRIPTGDSSYAVGGGLALVKSVDPAVLFASASYRHTFSRDFADVTRLEPEDRVDATLGYAYALNDALTLSTSLSGLFIIETVFDNATLRQQELFSLQFGLTSWLAKGLYIEPTVSFGLNGPGDSFVIGVTLPYTFTP